MTSSPPPPPSDPPFPEDGAEALAAAQRFSAAGRFSDAIRLLREAVRLRPDWLAARLQLGALFLRVGDIPQALAEAQEALRLEAGSAEAHRLQGAALYRGRSFPEAASAFKAWAEAATGEALPDLALGRALLMAGERAAAEEALRRAVGRDPKLLRGHLFLARLALAQNRLGQAQAHLKRAIASRRKAANLRVMLARVLLRRSRLEAARRVARAAFALDPGCDTAALLIAELHVADGEPEKAWPILRRLARKRPDWAELRALDEQLAARLLPQQNSRPADAQRSEWRGAGGQGGFGMGSGEDPSSLEESGFGIGSAGAALGVAAIGAPGTYGHRDFFDQLFLLRALILRQLRLNYRETRAGFLLEWARPLVVMVLHAVVFSALDKRLPAKIPVELFVIGSFTIWFAFIHVARGTMRPRRHTAGIPGVSEIHLDVSRTAWEFLSMLSLALLSVYILQLFGFRVPFPNILKTVFYFLLATSLGLGFGLVVRALARKYPATETLNKNFIWILYITSGHYYSIAYGRHGLAPYIWWDPLLHLAELERQALYPGYPTELVALWYPVAVALGLILTGLVLDKCTRHLAHD